VANNGIEAVNAVRSIPYDLVLMDTRMPEMDGPTAARMIRSFTGTHGQVPIIGLADRGDDDDVRHRDEAGITEVVSKPVDSDELAALIARLCADERTAAVPDSPQQVPEITPEERSQLKSPLASLDDIVVRRR